MNSKQIKNYGKSLNYPSRPKTLTIISDTNMMNSFKLVSLSTFNIFFLLLLLSQCTNSNAFIIYLLWSVRVFLKISLSVSPGAPNRISTRTGEDRRWQNETQANHDCEENLMITFFEWNFIFNTSLMFLYDSKRSTQNDKRPDHRC